MQNSELLRCENVSKQYQENEFAISALSNINLNVAEGDFLCIMGPSGSGKTSLINLIGLLEHPSSGTILFKNMETTKLNRNTLVQLRSKYFGYAFQNPNLIPKLSVYKNIELSLLINKKSLGIKERKIQIQQILELLDLSEKIKNYPIQLSGGQQQRVALARALVSPTDNFIIR